jgi:chaperonin GroEL (HSP60 family)
MKVVAAGTNPVQLTRGMVETVAALVLELKKLSTEIKVAFEPVASWLTSEHCAHPPVIRPPPPCQGFSLC